MAVLQRLQAAAGRLIGTKETRMSHSDLENETDAEVIEPLLPIEKKLIGLSLGLGVGLLIVLIALNHLFPIKL
jgi:hypothetical protein